ncbi:MAG TPA: integrase, partial [Deltaproteobacteria bacterium]|nr:integrase [Deltaproteobacteria bacterium]
QVVAGHADIRTTMKYVHVIPKKHSPIDKLPSIL